MGWELEPEGEALRKAVRWISERRREAPSAPLAPLVDEAGLRFDLSPLEQEFLWNTFVRSGAPPEG